MNPIHIYKLVVSHREKPMTADEMAHLIDHALHDHYEVNVENLEWQGTISTDKAEIVLKAKDAEDDSDIYTIKDEGKAN